MDALHTSWYVGLSFALLAVVISSTLIWEHLVRNHNPLLKKYVIRVILIIPVYAIESWFGLRFARNYIVWDTLRDCYEAFVIFSFYRFLVEYLGGESWLAMRLGERRTQQHTTPFCCLKPWTPSDKFVMMTKFGTLQYVFVKVIIAITQLVLSFTTDYNYEFSFTSAYLYCSFIVNCSQIWAIYCLALLYLATSDILRPIRPFAKFLLIKAVIFFTYWQSVLFEILKSAGAIKETENLSIDSVAASIQDFILCVEMFIFAIAFRISFPVSDFPEAEEKLGSERPKPVFKSFLKAANVADVVTEVKIPRNIHRFSMNDFAKSDDDPETRLLLNNEDDDSKAL
jgi:hypothetical protein